MDAVQRLARSALAAAFRAIISSTYVTGVPLEGWVGRLAPQEASARKLGRQVDDVVDDVSRQLRHTAQHYSVHLNDEKCERALALISITLESSASNWLSKEWIVETGALPSLVATKIANEVDPSLEQLEADSELRGLTRSAMLQVSYAIVAWVSGFPEPDLGPRWDDYISRHYLLDQTRDMLSQVRRIGPVADDPVSTLIRSQQLDISRSLGNIELFGLSVDSRYLAVPINVSYFKARGSDGRESVPIENLIQTVRGGRPSATATGSRLMIVGKAGSGKSTVAQWMAFAAAQRLLNSFASWNGEILPLFVRLRGAITGNEPPSDIALLRTPVQAPEVLVGVDWLHTVSRKAKVVIVLDGWDEIPQRYRSSAADWLEGLLKRLPDAHFVLTSRPEAVVEEVLESFTRVDLRPLAAEDAVEVAKLWYEGLKSRLYAFTPIDSGQILHGETDLLRDLRRPEIADIVSSPLLVAMLCCLYALGRSLGRGGRGRLYDEVTSALVQRDINRGVEEQVWDEFDERKKHVLIGALAEAMASNGVIRMPTRNKAARSSEPFAPRIIEQLLPLMDIVDTTSTSVLRSMLERSVVVQRVGYEDLEFAHKSLQDYYAAKYLMRSKALQAIKDCIRDGNWALLPFACYDAPVGLAEDLLGWAVEQIAGNQREQRSRTLLLLESLGAVTTLDRGVRRRVEHLAAALFPPRDEEEARSLAVLGSAAVPYLKMGVTTYSARVLAIQTLCRIGGSEAVEALREYAEHASSREIEEFTRSWERFDHYVDFGEKVLAVLPPPLQLNLTTKKRVEAASRLPGLRSVKLRTIEGDEHLTALRGAAALRQLTLSRCRKISSLEWTTDCKSLHDLSVIESSVQHLGRLGPAGLRWLELRRLTVSTVDWEELLTHRSELRVLWLDRIGLPNTQNVPGAAVAFENLQTFAVLANIRFDSLECLRRSRSLSTARIGWALSEDDAEVLTTCESLRRLAVRFVGEPSYANDLRYLDSLRSLEVDGAPGRLLQGLSSLNLRELRLSNTDLGSLYELDIPKGLGELSFVSCTMQDSRYLRASREPRRFDSVHTLRWHRSDSRDLKFLEQFESLRWVEIVDDGSLASLEGLERLPDECSLRLIGTDLDLDDSPLLAFRARAKVDVVYEPSSYSGFGPVS